MLGYLKKTHGFMRKTCKLKRKATAEINMSNCVVFVLLVTLKEASPGILGVPPVSLSGFSNDFTTQSLWLHFCAHFTYKLIQTRIKEPDFIPTELFIQKNVTQRVLQM